MKKRQRTSAAREDAEEWEVQAVTDSRLKLEYTVRWNDGSSTNEPLENLIPGSGEAVAEFHRQHPRKPNLEHIRNTDHPQPQLSEQLSAQLRALQGEYDALQRAFGALQNRHGLLWDTNQALVHENQMLKVPRLADATDPAPFAPHQKAMLEENARLKGDLQRVQERTNEANAIAEHWKMRAGSLADVDRLSQQLIAHNKRLLAQNAELWAKVRVNAGSTPSSASQQAPDQPNVPNQHPPAGLTVPRTGISSSKDTPDSIPKDNETQPLQEPSRSSVPNGSSPATPEMLSNTLIPHQSQTSITFAPGTPASTSKVPSQALKPLSTAGSPASQAHFNKLAGLKCHHCYHEHSNCSYVPGVECATCEKFGRDCREVARNEDGSFPLPRATLRQQRLRETKSLQAEQAKHAGDDVPVVVPYEMLKPNGTKAAPADKPDMQPKDLDDDDNDDGTSLFIPEQKHRSSGLGEKQSPAAPPNQTEWTIPRAGHGRTDWAAEAKVRCHACYHTGFKCKYVPGQDCYQCTRTDGGRARRICTLVETEDGAAPLPHNVLRAGQRKEKLRNEAKSTATATDGAPTTNGTPTAKASSATLSTFRKDNDNLKAEVRTLKAAQGAMEDTWSKQISLLEEALSKYPVNGTAESLPACRKCGSTESVGLREVPNGRLNLCHTCGLQMARQGKPVEQHDRELREEIGRLKAENLALSTEIAALKQRESTYVSILEAY